MPKADQTRAHIIEKTAPVFNTKGFSGTTLTDIEQATGLTKGSLYSNFASKDEVALAVFDYNLSKVNQVIRNEMAKGTTAREQLMAYVSAYGNSLKHPFPEGGCPILNTAVEADDTHPGLRQKASDAVYAWKNTIASIIQKGVKAGEFNASVHAGESALAIVATIEGAIMISKVTGRPSYLKLVMKSVEKMIDDLA